MFPKHRCFFDIPTYKSFWGFLFYQAMGRGSQCRPFGGWVKNILIFFRNMSALGNDERGQDESGTLQLVSR